MKTPTLSTLSLAAIVTLATASAAQANTVNFSGNNWDFGTVAIGQSGTVTTNPNSDFVVDSSNNPMTSYDLGYGFIPAGSKITFTYVITPPLTGSVEANGNYSFVAGNSLFTITSSNGAATEYKTNLINHATTTIAPPAALPVLTSANISSGIGKTVITNLSNSVVGFSSYFLSLIAPGSHLSVTYNVSAIPLPESVVLFASALMALAGFSLYRRRHQI
ncbi:MAG: hypothetical protein P4M15_11270 [Alphaproteobacteria bacterium]|nr:hypothetical protein [Alphaproteobacteria bacterium]